MKNKKLYARIGAIIACVLLVGALAVPCFADDTKHSDDATYLAWQSWFTDYQSRDWIDNPAMRYFDESRNYLYSDYDILASGILEKGRYNIYGLYDLVQSSSDDIVLLSRFTADFSIAVAFAPSTNLESMYDYYEGALIEVEYHRQSGVFDEGQINIRFFDSDGQDTGFSLRYNVNVEAGLLSGVFSYVFLDPYGWIPVSSIATASAVFGIRNVDLYYPYCFTNFVSVLFNDYNYSGTVTYPKISYLSYEVVENLDIDSIYESGYDKGYKDGLSSSDQYQLGYNEAVRQIDSGEFGENFLGNLFSAPLKALNKFVIVSTPNGVDITIGGLLSAIIALTLLIAFLKMYKGA